MAKSVDKKNEKIAKMIVLMQEDNTLSATDIAKRCAADYHINHGRNLVAEAVKRLADEGKPVTLPRATMRPGEHGSDAAVAIGRHVSAALDSRRIEVNEILAALSVSTTILGKIRAGRTTVSLDQAVAISRTLGMSLDALVISPRIELPR